MFCPECGTKNRAVSKFCMKCGAALPTSAGGAYQSTVMTVPRRPRRRGRMLLVFGVPIVLLIALGAGGLALLRSGTLPFIGGGDKMLVAFPKRNYESDLYLLTLNQPLAEGVLLAEDALEVDALYYQHWQDENRWDSVSAGYYGAFVPNSDQLLFWYREGGDDDAIISAMHRDDENATELMSTDALPVYLASSEGSDRLLLGEDHGNTWRCYRAQTGDVAQRLTKGSYCDMIGDGSLVYAAEEDGNELTVTLVDVASGEEQILLDDIEDVSRSSIRFSGDGSHMAYVQQRGDGAGLFLVDRDAGDAIAVGERYDNILNHDFIPGRDTLYYLIRKEGDDVVLYLSSFDSPVASGYAMAADADHSGNYLLYVIGDADGEKTAYLYNMGTGDVVMLLQGDRLEAHLSDELDTIFLWERDDDEFTLYSVPIGEKQLSTIADLDDVESLLVRYVDGEDHVFIEVTAPDGRKSLYATPLHRSGGFYIIEEWQYIQLLNISPHGDEIVFYAVEDPGDDPVLLLTSLQADAHPVELDGVSDGFANAVFSADGRDVIYTAYRGSDAEDYEIVRIPANVESPGELLFEAAYLDAVSWATVNPPFKNIFALHLQR